MPPHAASPASRASGSRSRPIEMIFGRITLRYPRNRFVTVNPASEEHGHADRSLKIVGGFFLTQQIDVEQVIAEINA